MKKKKEEDTPKKSPLEKLKAGNTRYINDNPNGQHRDQKRRDHYLERNERGDLINPQKPFAIILSCADSRVAPELIFDAGIGELFVVRVAGNIANPATIASIEYAVDVLKTKLIVVLGHQNCGAVKSAIEGPNLSYNLNQLLAYIRPALDQRPGQPEGTDEVIKRNAELTVKTLEAQSEIIRDATDVEILPAFYHLDGRVSFLERVWVSGEA